MAGETRPTKACSSPQCRWAIIASVVKKKRNAIRKAEMVSLKSMCMPVLAVGRVPPAMAGETRPTKAGTTSQ